MRIFLKNLMHVLFANVIACGAVWASNVLPNMSASVTLADKNGHSPVLTGFNVAPQWLAFQWGNPTNLLPAKFPSTSDSWEVTNAYSRIKY